MSTQTVSSRSRSVTGNLNAPSRIASGGGNPFGGGTGASVVPPPAPTQHTIVNNRQHLAPVDIGNDKFMFCWFSGLGMCSEKLVGGLCDFHVKRVFNAVIDRKTFVTSEGVHKHVASFLYRPLNPSAPTVLATLPELWDNNGPVYVNFYCEKFSDQQNREYMEIHSEYHRGLIDETYKSNDLRVREAINRGRLKLPFYNNYMAKVVTYDLWTNGSFVLNLNFCSSFTRAVSHIFNSGIPREPNTLINPIVIDSQCVILDNANAPLGTVKDSTGTILTSPLKYFDDATSSKSRVHNFYMPDVNEPVSIVVDVHGNRLVTECNKME